MKLKDFIEKLEEFDPDMEVCIWDDEYSKPESFELNEMVVIDNALVLGRGELKWYEKKWEDK